MPEPALSGENQSADLRLIEETWHSLQLFLGVEKCAGCECLQAGLTELVMALEAMSANLGGEMLLKVVRSALDLSKLHGCLGCDPCEPADVLASFYRARDARDAAARCGCGPSCTDAACTP
jgi:hypothetical protein